MCKELFKQINYLTFLVLEEETLNKLEEDLRDIVEDLKLKAPHEAGLIKESSSYVRSSTKKGIYRDPFEMLILQTVFWNRKLNTNLRHSMNRPAILLLAL